MRIRILVIGATFAGVLGSAGVNAQVLGGGVVGGADGAIAGGLSDLSMNGAGSAAGSLGADLDASTLRRTTRDVADRGVGRARGAARKVRGQANPAVSRARGAAQSVAADAATSASAAAAHAANSQHVAGAAAASAQAEGESLHGAPAQQLLNVPSADSASAESTTPSQPVAPTLNPALNASDAGSADAGAALSRDGAQARSSFSGDAEAGASVRK
jgi:hypothetical protein